MRLLTFDKDGAPAPGLARDDRVLDLLAADPSLPGDWPALLAGGQLARLAELAERAPAAAWQARAGLTLWPPIPQPPKILCVGLNYLSHARETGMPPPDTPIFFVRFPSSLVGDGAALVRPAASHQFDYEAELAVVIGRRARHVARDDALAYVAGYSLLNDGSLRDYQKRVPQWTLGKNFDASGSFGPELVTTEDLPAGAAGLGIETRLNGETVQAGRTDDLIFDVAALIEAASEVMTLEPGTVIATGTPPGVGMARTPPLWMQPGDTVEIAVEGIGRLVNPVVAER
jgi:2-keto-4-pentenoate hydratase/2-oxohepta-3-ene-1,7-dioic acid hydratase in catechol pathway